MQVDPIKPVLKAPGTKRLKLKCGQLLSNFAFNFNLHRYNEGVKTKLDTVLNNANDKTRSVSAGVSGEDAEVGRCRLTLSNPC